MICCVTTFSPIFLSLQLSRNGEASAPICGFTDSFSVSRKYIEYLLLCETIIHYIQMMRAQMSTEYQKILAVERQLFDYSIGTEKLFKSKQFNY